jgi:O-acetylhomoserine (thiol)-lyase
VDTSDPENVRRAIDVNTRLVYTESVGNPKNNVDDFEAIGKVTREAGIPFIVDNTVTTPYLFKPLEHGADIVVYSLTKFIGGHGTSIGGAVVDGGAFPWNNGKFPEFTEPDPSYHGLKFWDALGNLSYILRMRVSLLRDMGACISPFNSFQLLQGIETLHVRMPRHVENARAVAAWLEKHPLVTWVNYPGLASHKDHARAQRYLPKGEGAIIGFGIKGGLEAGKAFIDNVKLLSHLANVGDAKSLVIHPASTTHQQLSAEEQQSTGVTADYIRLSIGIESIDDILTDIQQALEASQG